MPSLAALEPRSGAARRFHSMKLKEVLVFVLLVASIVAAFGGFALVSRGTSSGWIGVLAAVPMLFVVQRSMRATSSPTELTAEATEEKTSADG
jgi:FtsH-binding integral membrane protein